MKINFFYLSLIAYITIVYLAIFTGFHHPVILGFLFAYILVERLLTQVIVVVALRGSKIIYDKAIAAGVDFSDLTKKGSK